MRGLERKVSTRKYKTISEVDTDVTPEMGQSSCLTCKSRGKNEFELKNNEIVGRRTGMTHARTVHLDEAFTRAEFVGLLDGAVFADFDRGPWFGDNGCDLDLWDRHYRSEANP